MFLRGKKAQSTLEYVIILVGIVIAIIAAKTLFGDKINKMIGTDAGNTLSASTDKAQGLNGYGD